MEIYLIRHGECFEASASNYSQNKNGPDPALTLNGISQAEKLSKFLKNKEFDRIYSSNLIRAQETAEILNRGRKSTIIVEKAFREINMGSIVLSSWDKYPKEHKKWLDRAEDIPYPDGENGVDVYNRCKPVLSDIVSHDLNRVAIVTHGGTIRSIISGILGMPFGRRFYLGDPLNNCSVSVLIYDEDFYLQSFNESSY